MSSDARYIFTSHQKQKLSDPVIDDFRFRAGPGKNTYFLVMRWKHIFTVHRDLLKELFSWTNARKADFDVFSRHKAGKLDHVMCQVHDPDGFTHIQHEDF